MSGPIDRTETIRAWCKLTCGCEPEECGLTIEQDGAEECDFVEFLWNRPEYEYGRDNEFVPVKHGRWIKNERKSKFHIEPVYICSCCREQEAWGEMELSNYCPNCGAKMEGEEDDER